MLSSTGWQIANNTEIMTNMDLNLAVALSDLYYLQAFLKQKIDKIGDNLYVAENINPGDVKQLVIALDLLMKDIIFQEEKLMAAYPRVLEKLSSNQPC